ncbi:hypothetical protein ACFXPX_36680 [Kitasatospora sp. NPDC059146]|uniref:hypothetical protein n=1 Tax=unclassified Kitasatospora TaxID=2633591 RepID=UPI00367959F7
MRLTALPENLPVSAGYLTAACAGIIASAHQNTIDEYGAKVEATEADEEQQGLSDSARDQVLRLIDDAVADAVVTVSWPKGHPLAAGDQGHPVVYEVGYAEEAGAELRS